MERGKNDVRSFARDARDKSRKRFIVFGQDVAAFMPSGGEECEEWDGGGHLFRDNGIVTVNWVPPRVPFEEPYRRPHTPGKGFSRESDSASATNNKRRQRVHT